MRILERFHYTVHVCGSEKAGEWKQHYESVSISKLEEVLPDLLTLYGSSNVKISAGIGFTWRNGKVSFTLDSLNLKEEAN